MDTGHVWPDPILVGSISIGSGADLLLITADGADQPYQILYRVGPY